MAPERHGWDKRPVVAAATPVAIDRVTIANNGANGVIANANANNAIAQLAQSGPFTNLGGS